MWSLAKRFAAVLTAALIICALSTECDAAVPASPAVPSNAQQCDNLYGRMNFLWKMFQKATANPSKPAYRFVESGLWQVSSFLNETLCTQTDKSHSKATMDAKRFQIGLLYTIIGAFTEANLKKYDNARAFTIMFHDGVAASVNNTKEAQAALKVVRAERPDFDQFLSDWTKQIDKLEKLLDKLDVPKQTRVDQGEKPSP